VIPRPGRQFSGTMGMATIRDQNVRMDLSWGVSPGPAGRGSCRCSQSRETQFLQTMSAEVGE